MGNNALSQSMAQQIKPKGCCGKISLHISNSSVDPCEITCAICFEIYRSPRIMKCRHKICSQCISQWGRKPTATCPFCRTVLRRFKGNFGKMDKATQKQIDELLINCRGCQWKGSPKDYLIQFGVTPTLDDSVVACEKMDQEKVEKQPVQNQCHHQEEKKEVIRTSHSLSEQPMAEQVKTVQQLRNMVPDSQLKINNPYGEDLFLQEPQSPISRYLSLDFFEYERHQNWENCFYFGDNEF